MRVTRHGPSLSVSTPAKLNLSLEVLGRRADGFHALSTVMISVQLTDRLDFSLSGDHQIRLVLNQSQLSLAGEDALPVDHSNLIVKAAQLLIDSSNQQQSSLSNPDSQNVRSGVEIVLTKRIPSQAGLGGGSSDAAATLVGLNQLWDLKFTSQQLHELAAQLGSDVNFFLDSHLSALCTSRGEIVEPIQTNQILPLVIVKPHFGLSTAGIFRELAKSRLAISTDSDTQQHRQVVSAIRSGKLGDLPHRLPNDLLQPAVSLNSQLNGLLHQISQEQVTAFGMTGSGSACFAICQSVAHARRVAARLRAKRCGHVYQVNSGV